MITITLSLGVIALAVYGFVTILVLTYFVSDEVRFANPNYEECIVAAVCWPLIPLQFITGYYILTEYRKLKSWLLE
jgi:hypothetical protein